MDLFVLKNIAKIINATTIYKRIIKILLLPKCIEHSCTKYAGHLEIKIEEAFMP